MKNPIVEEAGEVYIRRRECLLFHVFYTMGIALAAVLFWSSRGFMYFFRTESVPAVFQATLVTHLIAVAGISLYVGLDRLAESQIIRYTEWLERTDVPVGVLFRGKLAAAALHTFFIVALGAPFALIAAGPAGATIPAVVASEAIILLTGLIARFAGMIISHIGELRYVVRVIGGWLFVALLFVATIRIYQPINPIVAVVRQHGESSPFMQADQSVPFWQNPLVASGVPLLVLAIALAALYWYALTRHRAWSRRRTQHGS